VWWPRCIELEADRSFTRITFNSIRLPAERTWRPLFSLPPPTQSRLAARAIKIFAVESAGVIFSGATREPVVGGLTRPHSVRLHMGSLWWIIAATAEVGVAAKTASLRCATSRWTRGLYLHDQIAFVGTAGHTSLSPVCAWSGCRRQPVRFSTP